MRQYPQQSRFCLPQGGSWSCVALQSRPAETFEEEARALLSEYKSLRSSCQIPLFARFHLSDITRQQKGLEKLLAELWDEPKPCFVSYVGQAPVSGARLALEAWLIEGRAKKEATFPVSVLRGEKKIEGGALMKSGGLSFGSYKLFFSSLKESTPQGTSAQQTTGEFEGLISVLKEEELSLFSDVQRTWLYCRDVDNNYAGLVEARNRLFDREGLVAETHYLASTGIEGRDEHPARLVFMDSLIVTGLKDEQKEYMKALAFMSETQAYGVAFERGLRLLFGDMSLYFISGTASIDKEGEVVHRGDIALQTERTLLNIEALMQSHGGELSDLTLLTVYLRDRADGPMVEKVLKESALCKCPYVMVEAPVCRPDWLIEIEALGMNKKGLSGVDALF